MNYCFYPRVKVLHTLLISLALLLTACGGGDGDSSSGGGSSSVYTGTYAGSMTATLSSPGAPTQEVSGIMAIKIDDAGNVSVLLEPSTGTVWATGTLSGDNFTITSPFGFSEDGIVCNGPATMTGNIQNDQITGTFTGTIACTTQGITIPFTINGTYTVVKTSISAAVQSDGFSQSLLSAIQNVLRSAR